MVGGGGGTHLRLGRPTWVGAKIKDRQADSAARPIKLSQSAAEAAR